MEHSVAAILTFGFALGVQHSLDADHVAAVSTLVGRGGSLPRVAAMGAVWGLGHTAALLAAAVAVVWLRWSIAPPVADGLEVAAGVMLVLLGAELVVRVLQGRLRVHSHPHAHTGTSHRHLHVHAPPVATHEHEHAGRLRPFLVGVVHGLAGSAALMLAVVGTIDTAATALVYVVVFGLGTMTGMLALSALLGLPFRHDAPRLHVPLQLAIGTAAVAIGLSQAWPLLTLG
ncbi:MAG TPA: urease accessory protein [Candidatus Limnocylindria bacterium]|nr:urease accessory protein [Candidatus Limnocylindria bacterium]